MGGNFETLEKYKKKKHLTLKAALFKGGGAALPFSFLLEAAAPTPPSFPTFSPAVHHLPLFSPLPFTQRKPAAQVPPSVCPIFSPFSSRTLSPLFEAKPGTRETHPFSSGLFSSRLQLLLPSTMASLIFNLHHSSPISLPAASHTWRTPQQQPSSSTTEPSPSSPQQRRPPQMQASAFQLLHRPTAVLLPPAAPT